jgi:hypothetical protein
MVQGNSLCMAKVSTIVKLDPTGLSDVELELLWEDSVSARQSSSEEILDAALSGDDRNAAMSYLAALLSYIRHDQPIDAAVREYAVSALGRFLKGGVTLGVAFGTERAKRGAPPTRLGARRAIVGLVKFLSEERHFPLSEASDRPSAFLVAATLMQRKWKFSRSPSTVRDEYWNKRDKGD